MATGPASSARRGTWLEWALAIALLLAAFGYYVVRPLAERLVVGVLGGFGSVLAQLAETVSEPYQAACLRIEQGLDTRALFGEPVVCASLEETQWLDANGSGDLLEFRFAVSGPRGTGQAHVFATAGDSRLEPARIEVTTPSGEVVELLAP